LLCAATARPPARAAPANLSLCIASLTACTISPLSLSLSLSLSRTRLCALSADIFLGVSLGAEVFMEAIETVTAKETKKQVITADGTKKQFHVKVWNATVANLTLMALGSSAPEILLNVIEVLLLNNFNSGDLGPSTIVGSAAFNLMIITAVCIVCIPAGETRTIDQFYVFLTTAAYSVLAYIWLYIMVLVWTPEVITVAEAVITIIILIVLIIQAYILDRYATEQKKKVSMVCTYPPALKPTTTTTPRPACRI
jgi:Ca2+/Na+ antiporter